MPTLQEIAERRRMTMDEVSVADQESERIAKTLNELAATGRDLKAAGLMEKVEENQAVQDAMTNFRREFGFKTEVEQAAMRFGRIQKRRRYKYMTEQQKNERLEKSFAIFTSVCRADLETLKFDTTNVDDDTMDTLARKMGDRGQETYWMSLDKIAEGLRIPHHPENTTA